MPPNNATNSSRPDILVVHGALGSALQMQPVAKALGAVGEVLTVELPGHGTTPLGDLAFGMDTFVDALSDAVGAIALYQADDAVSAIRPIVFGYSMGGYVALALEAQRPGTFGGIVTLGTKFKWTPEVAARESSRLNAAVIAENVPKFAALLEERHAASGGWHEVLRHTRELLLALGNAPVLTRQTLSAVKIPVCVAVGDRDDTVTADEAREVAAWMARAVATVLPDVPHPIERVPVDAVVRLVRECVSV